MRAGIDAAREHPAEERRVALGVRAHGGRVVAHGAVREERREERAEGIDLQGDPGLAGRIGQSGRQPRAERGQIPVEGGFRRSRHQMPAVIASGLPESVPAW